MVFETHDCHHGTEVSKLLLYDKGVVEHDGQFHQWTGLYWVRVPNITADPESLRVLFMGGALHASERAFRLPLPPTFEHTFSLVPVQRELYALCFKDNTPHYVLQSIVNANPLGA